MSLWANIGSMALIILGFVALFFALKPFVLPVLLFIVGMYLVNYGLKLRRKPSLYMMIMTLFAARSFENQFRNFR